MKNKQTNKQATTTTDLFERCLRREVLGLVWITSRDMGVKEGYSDGHVDTSGWTLKFRFATKFPSRDKIFKASG